MVVVECGSHKRVARLMREDNLLAMQPKAFEVITDSDHALEIYLNLAFPMKLTAVIDDQPSTSAADP